MLTIGLIEGVAEATALISQGVLRRAVRLFPRGASRWSLLGYGLAALTKLVFPLAPSLGWVVGRALRRPHRQGHPRRAARRADRRHRAARDARRELRAAAGARHRRRASAGRCWRWPSWRWFADNFQAVFWVAVIPRACWPCCCSSSASRNPTAPSAAAPAESALQCADAKRLPRRYWVVVALAVGVDAGALFARRSWCCARRTSASASALARG